MTIKPCEQKQPPWTARIAVHNHGFVELLDVMGSDADIEQAARVSFTAGEDEERTIEQRRGLIRYLMRHRHTTPFEMAELKFRIALPIFVWRQWIRHRTASVNEISGRYAVLPDLYYVPEPERVRYQSKSNKQGSAAETLADAEGEVRRFQDEHEDAREQYMVRVGSGMAKELARINLPLSQYTVMVWKIDLHNLFHFLALRLDGHAQSEIRDYAEAIAAMVRPRFPLSWEAFEDFRLNAITLTGPEVEAMRKVMFHLEGRPGPYPEHDFPTKREAAEWGEKLKRFG